MRYFTKKMGGTQKTSQANLLHLLPDDNAACLAVAVLKSALVAKATRTKCNVFNFVIPASTLCNIFFKNRVSGNSNSLRDIIPMEAWKKEKNLS